MRNSDKWVRWNDRDDLQERFAIVTEARRWGTVEITLAEYIFSIGKIPDELIDEICEHIKSEAPFQKGKVIHINIQPLKDMTDDYQIKAIRERHERNNYNCYWAGVIRKAVSDIEYHYEAQYELAAAGAAQPPTIDATAAQTVPAAREHVTAVNPSTDNKSGAEWVRADDWARDRSKTTRQQAAILQRLRNARGKRVKTRRKHKGYDIYKDRDGREYYKASRKVCIYKKSDLEKDAEVLIQ